MLSFNSWIPSCIVLRIYIFKSLNPTYIPEKSIQTKKRTFHHGTLWIIWGNKNQLRKASSSNNFCILRFLFRLFPKPGTGKIFKYLNTNNIKGPLESYAHLTKFLLFDSFDLENLLSSSADYIFTKVRKTH